MRLLSLGYVEIANQRLAAHVGRDEKWKKKYVSFGRKLPGLIQVSGLAQAAIFVEARFKDDEAPRHLWRDLCAILERPGLSAQLPEMSLADYQRATRRAQEALVVLKRLSSSRFDLTPQEAEEGANA